MTPLLAFDRCKVCVNPAWTDLWVCEGDRDIIPAGGFRLADPAAADFERFIIASVPSKPVLVSLTYPSAFAMVFSFSFPWLSSGTPCPRRRRTCRTPLPGPEPPGGQSAAAHPAQGEFWGARSRKAAGKILPAPGFRPRLGRPGHTARDGNRAFPGELWEWRASMANVFRSPSGPENRYCYQAGSLRQAPPCAAPETRA